MGRLHITRRHVAGRFAEGCTRDLGEHPRAEQSCRWIQEVHDPVELVGHKGAAVRGAMNAIHVPLHRTHDAAVAGPPVPGSRKSSSSTPLQAASTMGLIVWNQRRAKAGSRPPSVLASASIRPRASASMAAHRHALAIDRIEAADGIAENDQPFRKVLEPVIAMPQAAGKAEVFDLRQGLALTDRLEQMSGTASERA